MARPPIAKFALVGPAQSGKTTLFCALTGQPYEKIVVMPKVPPLTVPVRDPRLVRLHQKEQPQSNLVFPTVELNDTASLSYDPKDRDRNVDAITQFRELDGLIAVIRAYDLEGNRREGILAEIEQLKSELFLEDLAIIERRIERLKADVKKPTKQQEEFKRELEVCERLAADISAGKTDALRNLSAEDEKKIRGFMLFSRKPLIVVANVADSDLGKLPADPSAIAVCLKLEAEILAMAEGERKEFMEMYGLNSLVLEGLVLELYRRLGYIMFFTPGEKETAGWGLKEGSNALEAAGKIHTDIQKGFITAEVLSFEDYEKHGSEREAKAKGRCRNEGKGYVVKDADLIEFKHS
jgi:ribosome-binding ATPase YchF (GTP1/OBG family)